MSIDTLKTYTNSRIEVLHEMVQYIEDPKKLQKKQNKSSSFVVSSKDELKQNILQKFGFGV